MSEIDYKPEVCECCTQSKTYILAIDKGTVAIARGVYQAVADKGHNNVHIAKEVMKDGYITPNQRSNVARPRAHGLIAKVKGERGNYLMTTKGADFLNRKRAIPKYAIMSKVTRHQIGYYKPVLYQVTLDDVLKGEEDYWEAINYEISEGRVIPGDDVDDSIEPAPKPEEKKCVHGLPLYVSCPYGCTKETTPEADPEAANPQYKHE